MSKFIQAIQNHKDSIFIIGEIKLASPTEGKLGSKEEITKRAKQYEKAGVGAISVVTEKNFFNGDPSFVEKIKEKIFIPILQKDFFVDIHQLDEAKKMGSDAILLIVKMLSPLRLQNLVKEAIKLNLEPIVEINDENELEIAINTKTKIIAVNARDLNTFKVSVDKACSLLKKIPRKFIKLGFSGIHSFSEVEKYKYAGANGVLVGTALMRTQNIKNFLSSLIRIPVKVKICGVRDLKTAKASVKAGADFLGFNFVATSSRFIEPNLALKMIRKLNGKVKTAGVFKDAPLDYVNKISQNLGLDFVQLHGNENNLYFKKIKKPVIKSIILGERLKEQIARYVILDRAKQGKGKMVNFEKAKILSSKLPIFFAGGLNPQNVASAVKSIRPFAVDVASGIETNGVADINKIKMFIKNAKGVTL